MRSRRTSSRRLLREYLSSDPRCAERAAGSPDREPPGRRTRRSALAVLGYFHELVRGERLGIGLALGALTVSTVLKLALPVITKLSIDRVFSPDPCPWPLARCLMLPSDRGRLLVVLAAAGFAIAVLGRGIRIGAQWCAMTASLRVQATTRRRVFRHALRLPLDRIQRLKSGGAPGLLRDDAGAAGRLIITMLCDPWQSVVQLAGSVALLAWIDWRMLLGMVVFLPAVYWTHRAWIARIHPLHRDVRDQQQAIDARLTEAFGGIRVIRGFARGRSEARDFSLRNDLILRQELRAWWWTRAIDVLWGLVLPAASAGMMIYGGLRVIRGDLTLGDLMMFLFLIAAFLEPLAILASCSAELQNDLAKLDRVLDLLEEPQEPPSPPGAIVLGRDRIAGRILLRNVSFRYPGGTQLVLRDIDLDVEPGQVIGLVGASGAGKTTLCNLIARFHDPTSGAIELDGVDLRRIDRDSYRRLLGLVDQDVFMFDGTVAENIAYRFPGCTFERIRAAARHARADEFIRRLPEGYDTIIGERGVRLSGGQRQRVAIARAILADPRIMIWDEATSHLDGETERIISENYRVLAEGRTCFVIAHHLANIEKFDLIVLLDGGRIVDRGTHAELLRRSDRYRRMLKAQLADPASRLESAVP
jgi:ATP-binding cassette subfamily B protein/subfamily B ATP-binding cassette protein MsbA